MQNHNHSNDFIPTYPVGKEDLSAAGCLQVSDTYTESFSDFSRYFFNWMYDYFMGEKKNISSLSIAGK